MAVGRCAPMWCVFFAVVPDVFLQGVSQGAVRRVLRKIGIDSA